MSSGSIGRSSGPQPWDTYSKTDDDNLKVSRVSSTDNAIVRFDGTSGLVQNSSVVIDDSGNVGIGTSSPFTTGTYKTLDIRGTGGGLLNLGTSSSAGGYVYSDGTNMGVYNNQNGVLDFGTSASLRMRIDSSGNLQFNSGYGSVATAYGCRAWVNFNGTGTVAIRASGNVSSITDIGTGVYTVNFTNGMPDSNYVTQITPTDLDWGGMGNNVSPIYTLTSSVRVITFKHSSLTANVVDAEIVSVSIFR